MPCVTEDAKAVGVGRMKSNVRYRDLEPYERAIVAIAVLLDGHDAGQFLRYDADRGDELRSAANELFALAPELRLPFMGTVLRRALEELRTKR